MGHPRLAAYRLLGVIHIVLGLSLLPLSVAFGLLPAFVLALAPAWLVILGVLLWDPPDQVGALLRRTHWVSAAIALLRCAHGILALRAGARSAAAGGGLLSAYGLLPLGLGLLLGTTAAASLWLARRGPRGHLDEP